MNQYIVPVKREIWEHTGTFIKTPIVVLMLIVLSVVVIFAASDIGKFGQNFTFNTSVEFSTQSEDARQFEYADRIVGEVDTTALQAEPHLPSGDKSEQFLAVANNISYMIFGLLMSLVSVTYLLSTLMADRKDGSVLFWKSMPISETQNVLNKVVVATVVLPGIGWLAGLILSVILVVIAMIVAVAFGVEGGLTMVLHGQSIISTAWQNMGSLIALSLWILPLVAWLLFWSAAATKSPFMFAFLPLIGVVIFEKLLLGTMGVWVILKSYLFVILPGDKQPMLFAPSWNNLWQVLMTLQFWLGSAVAGALLAATIWFRNNRFEN